MKYPSEFPQDAQARVEAETLRAYEALEQDVRGIERGRRDVPFVRCVMRIFLVYAHEAGAFGKMSREASWSARELDQRCREFLLSIVIDAWEDRAKDLGVRKMFSSPHNWGYSLDDEMRRKIERSPAWKRYQDLLLDAFDAQSVRAADGSSPDSAQVGGIASKTDNTGSSTGSLTPTEYRVTSPIDLPSPSAASVRRRAVVVPILKSKQWTVNKWGTKAGVGKSCPYDYLAGKRNLTEANRLALAQVLGLSAEDLPT